MEDTDRRRHRLSSTLAAVALGAYALCCVWLWVEPSWRPSWDSALYILGGRSLALGEGYRYLGEPFVLRPPGTSWLISILLPDGAFNPMLLNRAVMFAAAGSAVLVYLALARVHGPLLALAAAILGGTAEATVLHFNWIQSDFPFVALTYLSMLFLLLSAERDRTWWLAALAAGAAAAGALYVRSAAWVLLPGFLLVGWRRDRGLEHTRALLPVGVALVAYLPWLWHTRSVLSSGSTPPDQLLLRDYGTAFLHVNPSDPHSPWLSIPDWIERIGDNALELFATLANLTLGGGGLWSGLALLSLASFGWITATRSRGSILEWFGVAYLLLLLSYFTVAHRLLAPWIPLVYLYLLLAVLHLGRWAEVRFKLRAAAPALTLLVFASLMLLNATRFPGALAYRRGETETRLDASIRDRERVAQWIREHTQEDAVLVCNQAPVYGVLTGRRAYTYRFAPNARLLDRYAPDFVILEGASASFQSAVSSRASRNWILPSDLPDRRIAIYQLSR